MSDAFKIDARKFNGMCRQLSGLTATGFASVVYYEASKALEGAARNTKAASVTSIKTYQQERGFTTQPADLYAPGSSWSGRGGPTHIFGTTRRTVRGMVIYCLANRYPDALWALLTTNRAYEISRRIKARGLSKGSWYRLAKSFGMSINVPAYAKKAVTHTGKHYDDVSSSKSGAGPIFSLHVVNAQPTVGTPGAMGRAALQAAIAGRVKYFQRNLAKKVFESAAAIAKRYPGMKSS